MFIPLCLWTFLNKMSACLVTFLNKMSARKQILNLCVCNEIEVIHSRFHEKLGDGEGVGVGVE